MNATFWHDPMTGSVYLQNGGIKMKLDPMVADAFIELYTSASSLEVTRMRRLLTEECDNRKRLEAENSKLRERVAELDELLPENGRWFSFETVKALTTQNDELRELARDLRTNLRNRELILELMGMPLTAEQKAATAAISDRCDALGVEGIDE